MGGGEQWHGRNLIIGMHVCNVIALPCTHPVWPLVALSPLWTFNFALSHFPLVSLGLAICTSPLGPLVWGRGILHLPPPSKNWRTSKPQQTPINPTPLSAPSRYHYEACDGGFP